MKRLGLIGGAIIAIIAVYFVLFRFPWSIGFRWLH